MDQVQGAYSAYAPAALQAAEAAALQPTPLGAAHAPSLQHGTAGHAPLAPGTLQQLQVPPGAAAPLAFPPAATGGAYTMPPLAALGQNPLAAFGAPPQAPLTAAAAAAGAQVTGQPGTSGDVLYVNPRQLAAILRRRSQRAKQEERLAALRATKVGGCWELWDAGRGMRARLGQARSACPSPLPLRCFTLPWHLGHRRRLIHSTPLLPPAAARQVARQRGPGAGTQACAAPQWSIHEVGAGARLPLARACVHPAA